MLQQVAGWFNAVQIMEMEVYHNLVTTPLRCLYLPSHLHFVRRVPFQLTVTAVSVVCQLAVTIKMKT